MKLLGGIGLVGIALCCGAQAFVGSHAHFIPRSQANMVSRLSPEKHPIVDDRVWLAAGYSHSFRAAQIARYLFGCPCGALTFSGSRVAQREKTDILADYLGLPNDFKSSVRFCPTIQNVVIDCGARFLLDGIHEGLYCSIAAPLVYTNWNVRMREYISTRGQASSPAGYMSYGTLPLTRSQLVADVATALSGKATWGDMQSPLRFGKVCGTQTRTEVAELKTEFGWNCCNHHDCSADIHLFVSAPTGTRTTAEYLFEPVVGNNHHWEIGFGGHVDKRFYSSQEGTHQLWGWLSADVSHLCATHERRSFDLINGRGSRYMLLAAMDALRDDILEIPVGTSPAYQYTGHLLPAINATSLHCQISRSAQANISLGLNYVYDQWDFKFGYDLWLMSREKLQCRERLAANKYAVKGDAQMYGFADFAGITPGKFAAIPLSVSQHSATLYAGQNEGNATLENKNADNAQEAAETINPGVLKVQPNAGSAQVYGSNPIILLSDKNIDECSALAPRASSSTLFITAERTSYINKNYNMTYGIGLNLECGHSCNVLSTVGLWLHAGLWY